MVWLDMCLDRMLYFKAFVNIMNKTCYYMVQCQVKVKCPSGKR